MAYRCPVCETVQPDGEHLANHLAITAMLDREDHAAWLEDRAPEYGAMGPAELADAVTPHAETVELEEGPTHPGPEAGATPGAPGAPGGRFERAIERQRGPGRTGAVAEAATLDAETRAVLEEAREMTAATGADRVDGAADDDGEEPDDGGSS